MTILSGGGYMKDYDEAAQQYQPWLSSIDRNSAEQVEVKQVLKTRAGAVFGSDTYVAPQAKVFTQKLYLGHRSWIAAGAILRGDVYIAEDCSVNSYAHLAGKIKIGRGCRIAGTAAIYGFNHGIDRPDVMIKDQPITSKGVVLHEDVWVGANAVIIDGIEIGAHSVVAAGAVVTQSFGPYQVIAGNPARSIRDRRKSRDKEGLNQKPVRMRLFEVDPYLGFQDILPSDLQGWGSYEPVFEELIGEVKPKLIVEVGTWKGASAIHMAKLCRKHNIDTEIVCVDTWLGNWQHWSRESGPGSRTDLRLKNGFPQLYYQFLSNVISHDVSQIITPLPLTGVAGAKLFEHHNIYADLIYIDGDHEYQSVSMDLQLWLTRLAPGGVLLGDDFEWPGVQRAAKEIASTGRWTLESKNNKFLLRRRK